MTFFVGSTTKQENDVIEANMEKLIRERVEKEVEGRLRKEYEEKKKQDIEEQTKKLKEIEKIVKEADNLAGEKKRLERELEEAKQRRLEEQDKNRKLKLEGTTKDDKRDRIRDLELKTQQLEAELREAKKSHEKKTRNRCAPSRF